MMRLSVVFGWDGVSAQQADLSHPEWGLGSPAVQDSRVNFVWFFGFFFFPNPYGFGKRLVLAPSNSNSTKYFTNIFKIFNILFI